MAGDLDFSGGVIVDTDGNVVRSLGIEQLAHVPAVTRWRSRLAKSRSAGVSVTIAIVGDSMGRVGPDVYRMGWMDRLRRRFQGATPGSLGFLNPSQSTFSLTGDANWPGGDDPWTFGGAVVAAADYGPALHAVSVPSGGGSATISYFGDKVSVFYTRTPAGPTACAVTLDGAAQTPFNARATPEALSQQSIFGTHADFGFHTLVVTPNDGPLVLEGVKWFDNDVPFFPTGSVELMDCTHAGFRAREFATRPRWAGGITGADAFIGLVVVMLGVNDVTLGRTPGEYQADLVTLAGQVDSALGNSTCPILFVMMPTLVRQEYVAAAVRACQQIGTSRTAVYDVAALLRDRRWGDDLSSDGGHPNNHGAVWLAEAMGAVLDPTPTTMSPTTPERQVISATSIPASRSAWVEAVAAIAGSAHMYDEATASAVRERRHRVWLDPGTYQAVFTAEHATGRGDFEVALGHYVDNTPTMTTLGSVDTSTPAGPAITTTRLSTTAVNDVPGWYPLRIRKTNEANVGRFVQCALHKIA